MLKGRRTHKSTQTILRAHCPSSWYWTSILTSSLCLCCHIKHCMSNCFLFFSTFGNIFPFDDGKEDHGSTLAPKCIFHYAASWSWGWAWGQDWGNEDRSSEHTLQHHEYIWKKAFFSLMYQQCHNTVECTKGKWMAFLLCRSTWRCLRQIAWF